MVGIGVAMQPPPRGRGGEYSTVLSDRMYRGNGVVFRDAFPRIGSSFNELVLDLGLDLG